MARRWSINGRFLTQPTTGVQRYAREIVLAFDAHLASGHPLGRDLAVDLLSPADAVPLPLRAIELRRVGAAGGSHRWEQTVLPLHVHGGLISLCNTGPLLLRKHIVCIHDANTRVCPASYSTAFRAVYRVLQPALGKTAVRIATVSHHAADQLVKYGISAREKLLVAPDGHEHALKWQPAHSDVTRAAAGPTTVVIIGSLAPHKNMQLIVGMADALGAAGLKVAVAGLGDNRVFTSAQPGTASPNVTWLGRISDNELAALLRDSLCLAFPSLAEGFGLPVMEAMAIGCPVVVSDCASLPEICGDAALYASPHDGSAWLDCFVRLHRSPGLRSELIARGREQATRYSWSRSAEAYLEAMAAVDASHP